jgi:superfamily II DNA or RNA helicase
MQIEFQAGATVRARGGRFIVLSSDTIAQGGNDPIRRLRLRALEAPFRNEEICVLHPIENVEPDEIPELDILRPGRIARFQLLMDAIRLSLAPGDDRLVSSSRSKIDFEPYQQVPALRALELPRPRLLIADDVGLGKTIEAGLILRELNGRRRAARILVVSPASITEQWQTELATKFGFDFRIFDSEGVAEARRALEAGTNPWCVEPRVIASVDFIKRREGAFRELSASRWDVIIIDEAHHLASGGNDDDLTDRYRLARWLAAENTGGLLLLTATPHDGYDRNFSSLLELLEPSLVTPGRDLKYEQYRKHMVRRLKRHIRLADGSPKFVERAPVQPIPVTYGPAELELQNTVSEEAAALDLLADRALRTDRESIRLVATILRKRAASSLAAIRNTIAQRKENIAQTAGEIEVKREYLRALKRGDALPEEVQDRLERDLHRSYRSIMQRSGRELSRLQEETQRLESLEQLVRACESAPDAKLVALTGWLRAIHAVDPLKKVIVFSEYADTVNAIVAHLALEGYAHTTVTLTGEIISRADRNKALARFAGPEARILVATDVAGEGLNLQDHCHHLVHFELPWNPNRMEQRNGRIDRYGQTHPPVIGFLYAADSYEGEVLKRLVLKIEAQVRKLGSVGDVLGQFQADRIEELLSRPVSDLHRAVQEAEAQIDDELNRASNPRLRDQLGAGGQDDVELRRAAEAARRGAEEGVDLPLFLRRAVEASQGEVSAATDQDVLSEDHPRIEAAVRWVRATRFRQNDDHRLAYVVVPDLIEPDLIATFLITLADGTAFKYERFSAVRVTSVLDVSRDAATDELSSRSSHPGNIGHALLESVFGSWWTEARHLAQVEALRRADDWVGELQSFRGLERSIAKPELDRWDKATQSAILKEHEAALRQQGLFGGEPQLPPAVRRRLDEHRKRVEFQYATLDRRTRFEAPVVEPLGVLLRVPAHLTVEAR